MGLFYLVLQGVLYIVGAVIYALRIPERFAPGKFDIWGASHQIFHLFVLAAAVTHFWGLCVAYEYWHERALEVGAGGDVCAGIPYSRR
jgi:adiponectin receptor